jgi:hypothetical protein
MEHLIIVPVDYAEHATEKPLQKNMGLNTLVKSQLNVKDIKDYLNIETVHIPTDNTAKIIAKIATLDWATPVV